MYMYQLEYTDCTLVPKTQYVAHFELSSYKHTTLAVPSHTVHTTHYLFSCPSLSVNVEKKNMEEHEKSPLNKDMLANYITHLQLYVIITFIETPTCTCTSIILLCMYTLCMRSKFLRETVLSVVWRGSMRSGERQPIH